MQAEAAQVLDSFKSAHDLPVRKRERRDTPQKLERAARQLTIRNGLSRLTNAVAADKFSLKPQSAASDRRQKDHQEDQ
jgi:hypothetical protein